MVEKRYNVFVDNEIMYRNVTREEAELRLVELIDDAADEDYEERESHFYAIKPV